MTSIIRPCPNCKTVGKLHKSHSRNFLEKFLSFTKILGFYRCKNCDWRGILFRKLKFNFSFSGILKTVILLATVYYLVTYILKNYTN